MIQFTLKEEVASRVINYADAMNIHQEQALEALVLASLSSFDVFTKVATETRSTPTQVEPQTTTFKHRIKVGDDLIEGNSIADVIFGFVEKMTPKLVYQTLLDLDKDQLSSALVQLNKPTLTHREYTDSNNRLWYVFTHLNVEKMRKAVSEICDKLDIAFDVC